MGTNASFVPASTPECPYEPRMSRAQALALRAAGGLKENCVVVLFGDTPTIGTAGNTSPTEIELNPTSPTELGLTARVHTTFDNSAWSGLYDIDLGTVGSIIKLTDSSNNTIEDTDADSATVHNQFPWHRGTTLGGIYRDNFLNDVVTTGWDTQPGPVSDNYMVSATVDLTGIPVGGSFIRNRLMGTTVTISGTPATFIFQDNDLGANTIVCSQTGNTFNFNNNKVAGAFNVTANSTGQNNTIAANNIRNGTILNLNGSGGSATYTGNSGSSQVTRNAACTGTLNVANNEITSSLVITQNAGALGGALTCTQNALSAFGMTQNGSGNLSITQSYATGGTFTVNNVRGVNISQSYLSSSTVVQNRSLNSNFDSISNCQLSRSTVTCSGAGGIVASSTLLNACEMLFSDVTFTDPAPTVSVQSSQIKGQSLLNVQAGNGLQDRCYFGGGCLVNTGAFSAQQTIVDGAFTKTWGANQFNKRCDAGFDNIII